MSVIDARAFATAEGVALSGTAPERVLVAWQGFPCELTPTIEVSGTAPEDVAIRVDRGPIGDDPCPALAVRWGVELEFSEPVDANNVDLTVEASAP